MKKIVFEGLDGSGKDTQINLLTSYLKSNNLTYEIINSLGQGEIAKLTRLKLKDKNIPKHELTGLFIAVLYELREYIKAIEDQVDYIILNRWVYSTMAYNSYRLPELNAIKVLSNDDLNPDYIIYLDISPEDAIERLNKRDSEKEIFENIEELTRVSENYKVLQNLYNIQVIKTNNLKDEEVEAKRVHEEIKNIIFPKI